MHPAAIEVKGGKTIHDFAEPLRSWWAFLSPDKFSDYDNVILYSERRQFGISWCVDRLSFRSCEIHKFSSEETARAFFAHVSGSEVPKPSYFIVAFWLVARGEMGFRVDEHEIKTIFKEVSS